MRKHDCRSVRNLIVIEFTEVADVHFTFACICNSSEAIKNCIGSIKLLNSLNYIRKLTYARGLDYNSIGSILGKHLFKSLCEITDKRATDTARIHFGYLYSGVLKETAVNSNLAEFILNENYLFACVGFLDKLLYKSGFSCTEKA